VTVAANLYQFAVRDELTDVGHHERFGGIGKVADSHYRGSVSAFLAAAARPLLQMRVDARRRRTGRRVLCDPVELIRQHLHLRPVGRKPRVPNRP
jgi:hypothetical protein